jgi:hypothetical protein
MSGKGQLPALPGDGCVAFICQRGLRRPLHTATARAKSNEAGRIMRIRGKFRLPLPRRFPLSFADPPKADSGRFSQRIERDCSAFGLCRTVEELHTSDPRRTMTNQLYYGDNPQVLRDSVPTESVDLACLDQSKQELF